MDALVAQHLRQDPRKRATAMNVDSVSKKRCKQKWEAEKG